MQNGITAFEVKRLQDLDAKRSIRKERAHNSSSGIAYPVCGRTCASEFGLRSHLSVTEVVIAQRCSPTTSCRMPRTGGSAARRVYVRL